MSLRHLEPELREVCEDVYAYLQPDGSWYLNNTGFLVSRDAGVKFAIDSDAHSVSDLGNMPYGVGTAQRGWLTPDDVINTWPLEALRGFLRKGR